MDLRVVKTERITKDQNGDKSARQTSDATRATHESTKLSGVKLAFFKPTQNAKQAGDAIRTTPGLTDSSGVKPAQNTKQAGFATETAHVVTNSSGVEPSQNSVSKQTIKVPDFKVPKSVKHQPAFNLYLTKNSEQYFKKSHASIVPFTCEECGADFEGISDLIVHFRGHFNGSLHECSGCRTPFSSRPALKKHMEGTQCGSSGKEEVQNGGNGVVTASNGELGCDIEGDAEGKTNGDLDGVFSCKLCGKQFEEEESLARHASEHQHQELFTCKECGRCYQQEHMLESHIKIHHVELWSCEECGKSFENKRRLMVHYELHASNVVDRPHKCVECGKAFTARSKLLRHMRVHTGERPFQCEICGRGFNDRSNLLIHSRVHTGEKPYTCSTCGKCFSGKNDLNRHKLIHSGARPHTCNDCGKSFRERSKLTRHIKTHLFPTSPDKPYICATCGKGFLEKSKLTRHSKIHERDGQA